MKLIYFLPIKCNLYVLPSTFFFYWSDIQTLKNLGIDEQNPNQVQFSK